MIISKTPLRVSFAGGGSDFPAWFGERGGAVVSAAINKYCYLTLRELPPFFSYRSRFIWSRVEDVDFTDQIVHPAIRACLQFVGIDKPRFAFHHDADIPAQSGLGTSAAFTVGLLKALYSLQGRLVTPKRLALDAITVDQDYAGDVCGCQDQIASAVGGVNVIKFGPGSREHFSVEPVAVDYSNLSRHLMLFYTRQQRRAADVEQAKLRQDNTKLLLEQASLVDPCTQALANGDMPLLGRVLQRSWELKRAMAPEVSNPALDAYYERGCQAGAYGGKICGAGAGGSLLFVVPPACHAAVRAALSDLVYIPFKFDTHGSQLIHYERDDSEHELEPAAAAG